MFSFQPHFGDDKPILTPPPQFGVRPISEPKTPFDPLSQDKKTSDITLMRTSADGSLKEGEQLSVTVAKQSQTPGVQDQSKGKQTTGEGRNPGHSTSKVPDMLQFEMQKLKLDAQCKSDVKTKSRSRSASQSSSQSNSSSGSVKSVVKKNGRPTRQSIKSAVGNTHSKTKEKSRPHKKEMQESQNVSRKPSDLSCQSSVNMKIFEEFDNHPGRIRSMRRSSFGDSNSTSLEKMTQFIAQAINEDPNEIRKKLTAVEKNRVKLKTKTKQPTSPKVRSESSDPATPQFYPLASSSPQAKGSPDRMTFSYSSTENHNVTDSPKMLSSYALDNSVFPSEDGTSVESLTLKELDSNVSTPKWESLPTSPEGGQFVHIIPQFGDTYTVRGAKKAELQGHVPVIDPRRQRTQEIEERLNNSLPQNAECLVDHDKFSYLPIIEQTQSLAPETTLQSFSTSPRQRLHTSDSAVGTMSVSTSQDVSVSRHSWPEVTLGHQEKKTGHPPTDQPQKNTSQGGGSTASTRHVTAIAPSDGVRGLSLMGNLSQGAPSTLPMLGHQTGQFLKQDFSLGHPSPGLAHTSATFGNCSSLSSLYPSNNVTGTIGGSGMIRPTVPGDSFPVQNTGLSQVQPAVYNPPVMPHGLGIYPTQGLNPLGTFHGQVPFVQTVSASMGPKPSSLTPTYAHSFNVNIPHNIANPQVPLHLQSSSSMLPSSFTQSGVTGSMPRHLTPEQQMSSGLLQVKPDYAQGVTMPQSTQVIIPGEIKFPQYCCVGVFTETVIPLHNSSSRWMHCEIRSVLSTANGVQVRDEYSLLFGHGDLYQGVKNKLLLFTVVFSRIDTVKVLLL